MLLEVLHLAFVLPRLCKRGKRTQVASLACGLTLLARVQAIFAGFEFANHMWMDAEGSRVAVLPGGVRVTISTVYPTAANRILTGGGSAVARARTRLRTDNTDMEDVFENQGCDRGGYIQVKIVCGIATAK
jgi:hypothetical protein